MHSPTLYSKQSKQYSAHPPIDPPNVSPSEDASKGRLLVRVAPERNDRLMHEVNLSRCELGTAGLIGVVHVVVW